MVNKGKVSGLYIYVCACLALSCLGYPFLGGQQPGMYSLPNLNIYSWWDRIQYFHGFNAACLRELAS